MNHYKVKLTRQYFGNRVHRLGAVLAHYELKHLWNKFFRIKVTIFSLSIQMILLF